MKNTNILAIMLAIFTAISMASACQLEREFDDGETYTKNINSRDYSFKFIDYDAPTYEVVDDTEEVKLVVGSTVTDYLKVGDEEDLGSGVFISILEIKDYVDEDDEDYVKFCMHLSGDSCSDQDTIDEGDNSTYELDDEDYVVHALDIRSEWDFMVPPKVQFSVDGYSSSDLAENQSYRFPDNSILTVMRIDEDDDDHETLICFNTGNKTGQNCTSDSDCDDYDISTDDICSNDTKKCENNIIHLCRHDDDYCPWGCTAEEDNDCNLTHSCSKNTDCNDSIASTRDVCTGYPKRCKNILITTCTPGDGYCPEHCTIDKDIDCNISECSSASDCDDGDISTIDACEGAPKRCSHTTITGCTSGDSYCPITCSIKDDADCDECNINTDCDDFLPCTKDECAGSPKRCSHTPTGCILEGECYSVGESARDSFCGSGFEFMPLKLAGQQCAAEYECQTKICKEGICSKSEEMILRENIASNLDFMTYDTELMADGYEIEDKLILKTDSGFDFLYSYRKDTDMINISGTADLSGQVIELKLNKETHYTLYFYIAAGILIVLLVVYIAYSIKTRLPETSSSSPSLDPVLKADINKYMSMGYTKEQIEEVLINRGYSRPELERYFR